MAEKKKDVNKAGGKGPQSKRGKSYFAAESEKREIKD